MTISLKPSLIPTKLFPGQEGKNALYLFFLLLLYSTIEVIGISHHEMWRDELEPWLVGKASSSLADFKQNIKFECNPYIWYFILFLVNKITHHLFVFQIVHILFAIAAVYLFLRYGPFSKTEKLLFCLGYYIVFEYGIISRGYALPIFLLFLFVSFNDKFWKRNLFSTILIVCMANSTGGFGIILSLALLVLVISNDLFSGVGENRKLFKIRNILWVSVISISGIFIAIKSIAPTPDSLLNYPSFTSIDISRAFHVLLKIIPGFAPIPNFTELHFWNSNIFAGDHISIISGAILAVICLFILSYNLLLFSKNISVLLFYLTGTCGIFLLFYTNIVVYSVNASRYHGFLFFMFLSSWWLLHNSPELKTSSISFLEPLRKKLRIFEYRQYYLILLLSANAIGGAVACYKDYVYPFSSGKAAAQFITENHLEKYPIAGHVFYTVSPVSAYLNKPMYYPALDTVSAYPIWSTKNYSNDINEIKSRLSRKILSATDSFLVIVNFDSLSLQNVSLKHLADFKGSIVEDENYSVFMAWPEKNQATPAQIQ